ncbi:5-formyltetrahydrofolate cyclo-ligase [Clostridium collagenovorans DSM 3089]|uniref:5-formyltetrahydrofolate cyclo-ligase n=1 Tax=Clostridium collagenovorans DSM 3089 TaxID=1121306 RepID=A0A1M5TRG2_9CLOT|nr:5-formyltetrahydrofolate cyclo-ligase [Clostridium collagenovorans]SHH53271.1 5-formyltetrahydrofolate cyclo-ligase [Clostridium collagenovorans DSM 3089]
MKDFLRKELREKRHKLSVKEVANKSSYIEIQLDKIISKLNVKNIMLYYSFKNEVSTEKYITKLLNSDFNVILPYSQISTKAIIPYLIKNLKEDLSKSSFGILEPNININSVFPIDKIEVVVIPGIAFDIQGNRMGFGAGFYDRFLIKNENMIKIAICYDFQLLNSIPNEPHDVKMDIIITEERVLILNNNIKTLLID